jgi:glycosyltransferase involved in cell wall biosynthesis
VSFKLLSAKGVREYLMLMRKPVLTIFYQFDPCNPSIGGIQTVIRSFIKYAPSEFEVSLVGISNQPNLPKGKWQKVQLAGREINFLPLFTLLNDNFRSLVPTTIKYTVALLRQGFASDFMHFHRLEPTLAALNWSGEKTLFVHNDIQKQMQSSDSKNAILWRYFPSGYFALERSLVKQFDQIFACNTDSVKHYQQRYPTIADRVSYIKNSVDGEIFYPLTSVQREEGRRTLAKQFKLADETYFILFAGRLHPQKDPLLMVRSFATLNNSNAHLLIAGDGELATQVQAEIERLGIAQQVTMLGSVEQAELAELQRICSVFVLTSTYEGLPLVALEALACGTPVVTTSCGETPKLLNVHSGIVCQERNNQAIANALKKVLSQPADYPIDACVRVAEPYSARAIVSTVYRDMLSRWQTKLNPV